MSSWIGNLSEKVFDNFKKITPALVAIAILLAFLLFLPDSILGRMSLTHLPELWRQIIGLLFLLCVSLIGTMVLFSIFSYIKIKLGEKKKMTIRKKKISALSPQQKEILQELLQSDEKSILLAKNSGDTIYLLENKFIYMPSQNIHFDKNLNMILLYVPQPWLLELYNKNPMILEEKREK